MFVAIVVGAQAFGLDYTKATAEVRRLYTAGDYDGAIKLTDRLLDENEDSPSRVADIHLLRADVMKRKRDYENALIEYRGLFESRQGDISLRNKLIPLIGGVLVSAGRYEEALTHYHQMMKLAGDDRKLASQIDMAIAGLYKSPMRNYDESAEHYKKVLATYADMPQTVIAAKLALAGIESSKRNYEGAIKGIQAVLAEHAKDMSDSQINSSRTTMISYLRSAGNHADIIEICRKCLEEEGLSDSYKLGFETSMADAYAALGQHDKAIVILRELPFKYPSQTSRNRTTYDKLCDIYLSEGKYAEALAAAKVAFDLAEDARYLEYGANDIAAALKGLDGNLVRANAFFRFQKYGPAGEDGKLGTADDIRNPVAGVAEPVTAEIRKKREKALADVEANAALTDAVKARTKGYLYLTWGMPREALREFRQVYISSPMEESTIQRAANDVAVGLKALHGHTLAAQAFFDYQMYGPAGKDGRKGTDDDLTDPLASLDAPAQAAQKQVVEPETKATANAAEGARGTQ